MTHVIEVASVHKRFGEKTVLDGVGFAVEAGSVFGLLGRNGAGKTTLLQMMLGLATPTNGEIRVFGENALELSADARRRIGYLSEEQTPYDDLAFGDLLRFVAGFYDRWDWSWCEHLLERLGIDRNQRLDKMSLGQRRLAELMLAVAHRPELLILDDPAIGLDVNVRREMLWTLLETVQEQGVTVVLSSHILQDVERVVDHVAILRAGELRVVDELDALKARMQRVVLPTERAIDALPGEIHREVIGSSVAVVIEGERGVEPRTIEGALDQSALGLEDIFVAMTAEEVTV